MTEGRDVTLTTPDGPMRAHEARPTGSARGGVVVVPEAFGLNDHIEDVARRFADAGYHAVAPDVFHRSGGATAPYDDPSQAIALLDAHGGDEHSLVDVDAALGHLREAGIEPQRAGVVGFCFGGRVAFLVALRRPIGAAVTFYGGGIVRSRFPRFPPLVGEAAHLQVPWLGLFGDRDPMIPVDDVERLRVALLGAAADTEVVRYPDAGHGFHCDQRDSFSPDAAADAWARTLAWLDRHVGPGRR